MKRLVIAILLLLVTPYAFSAPRALVIENATIVDPARGVHETGMSIVIDGERIKAVFPTGKRPRPQRATVLDAQGRFVIPGLIDAHTHLTAMRAQSPDLMDRNLERMLWSGVVVARDMAGDTRFVAPTAEALRSGRKIGPDIFYSALIAGPDFIANDWRVARAASGSDPGDAPWMQAVTRDSDVSQLVTRAAGTKARGVKLYVGIEPDLIRTVTAEAHRQGLKVWAHAAVYPSRPIEVVRAGVDVISHVCGLAWEDRDLDPTQHARINIKSRPQFDPQQIEAESPEMTELFAEMVRRRTMLDATLTNHERPGDDPYGCTSELMIALARSAARAGVQMVTGTDYETAPADPYPSLHLELESLVRNEVLTPAEALVAATLNGARALGMEKDYGTIEPGKLASLVLLAADPSNDIGAIRTVVSVLKRGKVYERPAARGAREEVRGTR